MKRVCSLGAWTSMVPYINMRLCHLRNQELRFQHKSCTNTWTKSFSDFTDHGCFIECFHSVQISFCFVWFGFTTSAQKFLISEYFIFQISVFEMRDAQPVQALLFCILCSSFVWRELEFLLQGVFTEITSSRIWHPIVGRNHPLSYALFQFIIFKNKTHLCNIVFALKNPSFMKSKAHRKTGSFNFWVHRNQNGKSTMSTM